MTNERPRPRGGEEAAVLWTNRVCAGFHMTRPITPSPSQFTQSRLSEINK